MRTNLQKSAETDAKVLTTVRISSDIVDRIRIFSEKTGIPMGRVFADSASAWLDGAGKAVLDALNSQSEK
jgi:hypothetical protein